MAMSPLWRSIRSKKLITKHKRPSPKQNNDYQSLAQGLLPHRQRQSPNPFKICDAIKGISLFTFFPENINAGLTVEAAMVLPLFLFFFLNLGCAIEMIRLHGNLELALCDVGNRLAVYGYVRSEEMQDSGEAEEEAEEETEKEAEWWNGLAGVAFSYTYIKKEVVDYLGEEYLEESPLAYGAYGLQFLESNVLGTDGFMDLIVTYKVSPFSDIAGFWSFRMANRYYAHLWTGYEIPGSGEGNTGRDVVYVTENGEVYHEDRNCTHLSLSIRKVSLQDAYDSRNANGEKYSSCRICRKEGQGGEVYIAEDGTAIHYTRDCPGLKRMVYAIFREEAKGYRPCQRCAGE